MAYPITSIDSLDIPLALRDGPMRDREEDRSTYLAGRRRTRRKGALWLQLSWEWTFIGTAAQWSAVRALLEGDADGTFDFNPRGSDDPYWPLRCRCTSPLPHTSPLYFTRASGERLYRVDVRVEAVDLVDTRPPMEVGPVVLPPSSSGPSGGRVILID